MGLPINVKVKSVHEPSGPSVLALNSDFCSMKRLGILLLPPRWDASPSQGTQHEETRSVTSPPGWDASPSQDTQHEATWNITTPPWMGC